MHAAAVADELHADAEGIPARFLVEVAAATSAVVQDLEAVDVPLLVLHGTADRMAAPELSAELVERASSPDKALHLVEGGYHALLRDVGRERTEDLVVAWIEARLPGR
jgi:alpha-beta hydrolase superfamily lysophospholipase